MPPGYLTYNVPMDPIYNFATDHGFVIASIVALVIVFSIAKKLFDVSEPDKWDHRDE
jgi:hypothetical protein